jgi:hypothetical protein
MKIVKLVILALFCCAISSVAEAKWWIFGQSENEISTKYLYLNGIPYDELGDKVTIYRETLENGQVVLRGKAATSSSAVGSVQVSLNNKESWTKASKTFDGAFEYSFRPETGKNYVIFVKIIDTTGKTNEVDSTRKEVTISEQNIGALIRQAMDELLAAYMAEDPARLMKLVSENFAADSSVLDRAIRKDFSKFDNIDLRYTLNNVTATNEKIYAAFTFSRKLTSTKSGKTLSDKGTSEFVFALGEKGPLVFSMKNPLIFGLSDAGNVATGTTNSGSNDPIIVVTSSGDVITQPFSDAIKTIDNDGVVQTAAATIESGPFTLNVTCVGFTCSYPGFEFATGDVVSFGGDINLESNLFFLSSGNVGYKDLGITGINTVTQAPASGYTMGPGPAFQAGPNVGHTFAFIVNGKYALQEIVSYTDLGGGNTQSTYRYKYQTDGTRNF